MNLRTVLPHACLHLARRPEGHLLFTVAIDRVQVLVVHLEVRALLQRLWVEHVHLGWLHLCRHERLHYLIRNLSDLILLCLLHFLVLFELLVLLVVRQCFFVATELRVEALRRLLRVEEARHLGIEVVEEGDLSFLVAFVRLDHLESAQHLRAPRRNLLPSAAIGSSLAVLVAGDLRSTVWRALSTFLESHSDRIDMIFLSICAVVHHDVAAIRRLHLMRLVQRWRRLWWILHYIIRAPRVIKRRRQWRCSFVIHHVLVIIVNILDVELETLVAVWILI